jgi:hypothetical protein
VANITPPLTVEEIKLLLRLRQLRKNPPKSTRIATFPLKINATGVWELLEKPPKFISGSVAGY